MSPTNDLLSGDRSERLLWELLFPILALVPAYALAPFAPFASLGYLCLIVVPIAIVGGILGEDRRAENAVAAAWFPGEPTHADNDAKIGGTSTPFTEFASSVGILALLSFVVVGVVFV